MKHLYSLRFQTVKANEGSVCAFSHILLRVFSALFNVRRNCHEFYFGVFRIFYGQAAGGTCYLSCLRSGRTLLKCRSDPAVRPRSPGGGGKEPGVSAGGLISQAA